MKVPHARLVLRARGPLDSLDGAVALARSVGGAWARLFAVVVGPPALLLGGWVAWAPASVSPWVFALALWPALQLPFLHLGATAMFGDPPGVRAALWGGLERAPAGLVWVARAALVVGASALCLGLPALPLLLVTLWWPEVHALERQGIRAGFARMVALGTRATAHALVGVAMTWVLPVACVVSAEATGDALWGRVLQLGQPFGSLWEGAPTPWAMGGWLASAPLVAWARLVLYLDARTLVDGWDLQVDIAAIVAEDVR